MRQVFTDPANKDLKKSSFFSPSSGFVAFDGWVGITTDSGRSFSRKYITYNNVNYNGYSSVNLTFGFTIRGVKAFDANNILVYGDYGMVPAILKSTDGGDSFVLVFHSLYQPLLFNSSVVDMIFPDNGSVGYATDADRVLKTTNKGASWSVSQINDGKTFYFAGAPDINNVFLYYPAYSNSQLIKIGGGVGWTSISLPRGQIHAADFITSDKGWINIDNDVYYTSNAGAAWVKKSTGPFNASVIRFTNDSTGYGISGTILYKTSDSGRIWEPLPRDMESTKSYSDIQFISAEQFWAGGDGGFLEITTNSGGTPYPKAFFAIDTTGMGISGPVRLVNNSRKIYSYKWFRNDTLISTEYEASYTHHTYPLTDTIKLVVSNGAHSDSLVQYQSFSPPVIITAFSPASAPTGATVTITGNNFIDITAVKFGNVPAASFKVISEQAIQAVIGNGASGNVAVTSIKGGTGLKSGFSYIPAPVINTFSPTAATAGSTITINGSDFIDITAVSLGGIPVTSFTVVSSSIITAIVPSGVSGNVQVTNKGGTVSAPGFVAVPTINSFTPAKGIPGTQIRITGTSLAEVKSISIGGTTVKSFTIQSANSITLITGNGSSGNVSVTTPGGTSSLPGFTFVTPPAIASFFPASGPVGTTVTITGSNFIPSLAGNIVYFGTTKAIVITASATTLTVAVPAGSAYEPITVTSNDLIAYSKQPFHITFPDGAYFTPRSFKDRKISVGETSLNYDIKIADMDGDGKTDIIVFNTGMSFGKGIAVRRNVSTGNELQFEEPVLIPGTQAAVRFAVGDMDGDGKTDIVYYGENSEIILIRNLSTPGNLAFGAPFSVGKVTEVRNCALADIDSDGKTDILVSNSGLVDIFRNIGYADESAFEHVSLPMSGGLLTISDVDIDGKPDIIITNHITGLLSIVKNNSTPGNISLTQLPNMATGKPFIATAGDIDEDGLPDIVAVDYSRHKLLVFRNTGAVGSPAFASETDLGTVEYATGLKIVDINGDGKLDIAVSDNKFALSVFDNISVSGSIKFRNKVGYTPGVYWADYGINIADLNGDNRPDILTGSDDGKSLHFFINQAFASPYISSFSPSRANTGAPITIKGAHFYGTTSVSFGGILATSFNVDSDTSISAIVGPGAIGNVIVKNAWGADTATGFIFGELRPVITSFYPASGPVGSEVIINGTGFSSLPTDNIVYFGGVKTIVTAARPEQLTIKVPAGAAPQQISVTVDGFTAYTTKPFIVTFTADDITFTDTLYKFIRYFPNYTKSSIVDFDGDGKQDILMLNKTTTFFVARNTSAPGQISFKDPISCSAETVLAKTVVADLDGDGRIDVVGLDANTNTFSVFRNITNDNIIAFGSRKGITISQEITASSSITICDMDQDGRPDILVTHANSHKLHIFKNISTPGNIAFDEPIWYYTSGNPIAVTTADLDGDKNPDVIVTDQYIEYRIIVYRNTSNNGKIQLSSYQLAYSVYDGGPGTVIAEDLDGDDKAEILIPQYMKSGSYILHNQSSAGKFVFTNQVRLDTNWGDAVFSVGDIDGDGKPDIMSNYLGRIRIFINKSKNGELILADKQDVYSFYASESGQLVDIDGDGLLDQVIEQSATVLRNTLTLSSTIKVCPGSDTVLLSGITGTAYQWQINTGNGFSDISNNLQYTGAQTGRLQIHNIPDNWNGYQYRCLINNVSYSTTATLLVGYSSNIPAVTITVTKMSFCTGTEVTFTAIPVNGGSAPVYQWKKNGSNVGNNSPIYVDNNMSDKDTVIVQLTSNAGCLQNPVAISNKVGVNVMDMITPSVSIAASETSSCAGSNVTFTATQINGGTTPAYQWKKNGLNVGSNNNVYTDNTLKNGDIISVVLISNAPCAVQSMVASNNITMIVNSFVPSVSIAASATVICPGTNVVFTASAINGGSSPTYQWKKNGVSVGNNSNIYTDNGLSDGDIINVVLTSNATCLSAAVATSNVINLVVTNITPPMVSIKSSVAGACAGQNITFTATPVNGGVNPVYQWQIDGVNAGNNSNIFTTTSLTNGARVKVLMTISSTCGVISVTSNVIVANIDAVVKPTIVITGGTDVSSGQDAIITSQVSDEGSAPIYQWQDSTSNHGWTDIAGANKISLVYKPAITGDKIRCLLSSSASCAMPQITTSNQLMFTISSTIPMSVHAYPNPVTDFLVIDSLKLSDNWEILEIYNTGGSQRLLSLNIANQTQVRVFVAGLSKGLFVAVLRRKDGAPIHLKILKM